MMPDFEHVRAIKEAAQRRLMAIPGVHAVGVGPKYRNGLPTEEFGIVVLVYKKRPLAELADSQVIPSEIDGVPVDVEESSGFKDTSDLDGDDHNYHRMEGGIQIQARGGLGGIGTLGCIARTVESQPKVVAITCSHVVGGAQRDTSELSTDPAPSQQVAHTLTFIGTNTPGTEIVLEMTVMPAASGPSKDFALFYETTASDTLANIATTFAGLINSLPNSGVSASFSGPQLTINWNSGFIAEAYSHIFGPRLTDPDADLKTSISNNQVTFSGKVSSDRYGIFTSLHLGGDRASEGAFTAVKKNDSLTSVANAVAKSINDLSITGVNASPSPAKVTITGAEEIACDVTSDIRVGQAGTCYCSRCCWCCGQQLGRPISTRLSLDVALVQLKAGLGYKAEIEDLGVIQGTFDPQESDVNGGTFEVQKHGRSSGTTKGVIRMLHIDGVTPSRYFTDAMMIVGDLDPSDPQHIKRLPFGDEGDSGSAVVRVVGNKQVKVIGILFSSDGAGSASATPIGNILSVMKVSVATATASDVVLTVSDAEGIQGSGLDDERNASIPERNVAHLGGRALKRLEEVQKEILSTTRGRQYAAIVERHAEEALRLVNTNKRIATIWHRNEGPAIISAVSNALQFPKVPMPKDLNGRPIDESVRSIAQVFRRYASEEFVHELEPLLPLVAGLPGRTYHEFLDALDDSKGRNGGQAILVSNTEHLA